MIVIIKFLLHKIGIRGGQDQFDWNDVKQDKVPYIY
jgi:hypothetical protein